MVLTLVSSSLCAKSLSKRCGSGVWAANALITSLVAASFPAAWLFIAINWLMRLLSLSSSCFMVSPVGCGCVRNTMINPAGDATHTQKVA